MPVSPYIVGKSFSGIQRRRRDGSLFLRCYREKSFFPPPSFFSSPAFELLDIILGVLLAPVLFLF